MASILVIEGSEEVRARIRDALRAAGTFSQVLEAGDGYEGLRLLMAETVDVVLADYDMPRLEGEKLLRMKDASPGGANIPFVFLTGARDGERRARLLREGAADAIEKPPHLPELVARLALHLRVKRLHDELRVKNQTLARLSTVDGLTGLRARRYLDEVLNLEFLRARRYRTELAVVMADLDHFKRINDEHGHVAGDTVLRGVSELLRCMVRSTDVAARYGGEELVVVQPQSSARGAAVLAERLREAVESARFEHAGARLGVTLSIGVAQYDRRLAAPEELIARADRALYAAKEAGRNRVVVDTASEAVPPATRPPGRRREAGRRRVREGSAG